MTKINSKQKTFSKFATIFVAVLCLAVCISCAELFSTLITVGTFSYEKNTSAKQQEFSLYAIKMFSAQSKAQAEGLGQITQRKNGAGYIYKNDEEFAVLASCYENKNDATKVISNLSENGTECSLLELNFKEVKLNANVNEKEKSVLTNAIQSFKNIYKKLYDLSVSVDTNLLTEIKAKNNLKEIIDYFSQISGDFNSIFNSKLTSAVLSLKICLKNVSQMLTDLYDFSSTQIPYSSQIKLTYFKVIFEYQSLSQNM